jgi:hypothetical protein
VLPHKSSHEDPITQAKPQVELHNLRDEKETAWSEITAWLRATFARVNILTQVSLTLADCRAPNGGSSDGSKMNRVATQAGAYLEVSRQILVGILFAGLGLGWCGGFCTHWLIDLNRSGRTEKPTIETVVEQIIKVESNGDVNARNKRSSATGPAQFLNETWLELIRTHRPDLAMGRSEGETLELRQNAKVAREITARFTEQNAEMLKKRGLPITPGTLYLAHFAGGAGAVAILSAQENADAASIMASADATGRTTRQKIVKANPFLEHFTIADVKSWADRKMRICCTGDRPPARETNRELLSARR